MNRFVLIALAAISLGIAASVAYAAIPDGTGVIHGCYGKNLGLLRVIDTDKGQRCLVTETGLSFNQAGPPGTRGLKGDKGDPGAPGAPGAPGVGAYAHSIGIAPDTSAPLITVDGLGVLTGFCTVDQYGIATYSLSWKNTSGTNEQTWASFDDPLSGDNRLAFAYLNAGQTRDWASGDTADVAVLHAGRAGGPDAAITVDEHSANPCNYFVTAIFGPAS